METKGGDIHRPEYRASRDAQLEVPGKQTSGLSVAGTSIDCRTSEARGGSSCESKKERKAAPYLRDPPVGRPSPS